MMQTGVHTVYIYIYNYIYIYVHIELDTQFFKQTQVEISYSVIWVDWDSGEEKQEGQFEDQPMPSLGLRTG